ncbi:MAG TPA: hypothetical protein VGL42_07020 [Opitutaceae bacterium]|jgi:hypothetical protein
MRKYLNNPWFVAVLAVSALAVAAHAFMAGADQASPAAAVAETVADPVAASAALPVAAPAPQATVEAALSAPLPASQVPDPFGPSTSALAEHKSAPLRLAALWTENGRTLGILNGKIVQAGDRVGTVTVVEASSNGLVLEDDERRGTLAVGDAWTPAVR